MTGADRGVRGTRRIYVGASPAPVTLGQHGVGGAPRYFLIEPGLGYRFDG